MLFSLWKSFTLDSSIHVISLDITIIITNFNFLLIDKNVLCLGMNVPQLLSFCEVMKTGSVSQAARNLGRTQPAISLSIKSLEELLAVKLFVRDGHSLHPVPEAHYLFEEARNVLDRLNVVTDTMKNLARGQSGALNVAAMPGPSTLVFPRFVAQAIRNNENIKISLSSRSSQHIREMVGAQTLDFGFADAAEVNDPNALYEEEKLAAPCLCAVPADHPLALKDCISIKDLDGVPQGTLQNGHPLFERVRDAFALNNVEFVQQVDSQIVLPLMQFVQEGLCCVITDPISAFTQMNIQGATNAVVFRPLKDEIFYDYAILTRRYRPISQTAKVLLNGWRSHFSSILNEVLEQ